MIYLHLSTWLHTNLFQTYTDQNRSFVYEERDQQSQNNEECLEDIVHLEFKTKINVYVCEIQDSMQHGIHCFPIF